ncbi:hypothetical protein DP939_27835 [Spongiactinospora rosea]|uniref:Uncharacterized protein n=1 Tax=Spongiactinospora rosea TaxID=2248750 RepID=A0A366LTE6_9ACTN|nr:hypothetical protein [Spongiactinospora rosea]RBQ16880.1 hypothetical protein DP939_27835 [Spongiactinospora rosea]
MSRRSLALLAASICTAGLAAVMYFHDFDLVLVSQYLEHPFALGALACVLLAAAAVELPWMWLRVLIGALAGLGLMAALFVGWVFLTFGGTEDAGYIKGPGPYRIHLQQSMAGLGPDMVTWLSLRRENGLLTREWDLGCFNDDVPEDAFDSVKWTGPNTLEIRVTDGRTFPIPLDPTSGRPQTTTSFNC